MIEWLMLNHPHDCPVCDEGGECHLQDMTVMTGHNYRRFAYKKRTSATKIWGRSASRNEPMHTVLSLRALLSSLCGRPGPQRLRNPRPPILRTIRRRSARKRVQREPREVCPTGVFTDKTLRRHFTRKWDLQTAPSICVHCGVGCNTIPGERYGTLRRIQNRYNHAVNGYFLCDRGRFGYEFVNSPDRFGNPWS